MSLNATERSGGSLRVAARHGHCFALLHIPALLLPGPFFLLPPFLRFFHAILAHLEHFPDHEIFQRLLPQTLHLFCFCFIPSVVLDPKVLEPKSLRKVMSMQTCVDDADRQIQPTSCWAPSHTQCTIGSAVRLSSSSSG